MNLNLESLQVYNDCWIPKHPQEGFSCECGERLTEIEHSKYNGLCYGCLDLSRQEAKP